MMRRAIPVGFPAFLVISAAVIVVTVVISGLMVGSLFENHMLAHEGQEVVDLVQSQAVQHLIAAAFQSPTEQGSLVMFQTFFEGLPAIFRVKAYDASGTIVWSNDPTLIGLRFLENLDLTAALAGRVRKGIERPRNPEHAHEAWTPFFFEVYVPIAFPGSPRVVGVVEAYKDMAEPMADLARTQRFIWLLTSGIGLVLYVTLALVVRQASANERRAISRLEEQNRELTALQAELVEKERLAAVGQVVVSLHHAILNPLTGILGALMVLKSDANAADRTRALGEAEGEIRKIERLIRQLPELREARGVPYVGKTTMLDLDSAGDREPPDRGI